MGTPTAALPSAVFVYGTLQRGQCRESCWPSPPIEVVTACVRAELYDLGPYPAITTGEDWVRGELWRMEPDAMRRTLEVLDEIEEYVPGGASNLYERLVVPVYGESRSDAIGDAFAYFMLRERLPPGAVRIRGDAPVGWPVYAPGARRG